MSQPHHYAQNNFPSDDDEYYNQSHQQFSSNQKLRSYSIDQPDIFEPYIRNEQIGQPRTNPTPYNISFQQQKKIFQRLSKRSHCKFKSKYRT